MRYRIVGQDTTSTMYYAFVSYPMKRGDRLETEDGREVFVLECEEVVDV